MITLKDELDATRQRLDMVCNLIAVYTKLVLTVPQTGPEVDSSAEYVLGILHGNRETLIAALKELGDADVRNT